MRLPRVYPILDTQAVARRGCDVAAAARALVEGGAEILQVRHKGHWGRDLFEEARAVRDLGVPLIVNDRADIALLLGAGLHIGQDDLPAEDARRLMGPEAVIGFSTHNPEQLRAAAAKPVDYLALGPIFATGSKEKPDLVVGVENLRAWRRLTGRPLVAIGGITRATASAVFDAGADSVAIIADLLPDPWTPAGQRERMEEWRRV